MDEDMGKKKGGRTRTQYDIPKKSKQIQDLIEHRDMNFARGNIFKACYREKGDWEYDLNKIIWFSKRELKRIKKERKNDNRNDK